MVAGRPHLGTDRLVRLLRRFREYLQSLGVVLRFGSRVEDLLLLHGHVVGVRLAGAPSTLGFSLGFAGAPARLLHARLAGAGGTLG